MTKPIFTPIPADITDEQIDQLARDIYARLTQGDKIDRTTPETPAAPETPEAHDDE